MDKEIFQNRVASLPPFGTPNYVYYVPNGNGTDVDCYVVDNGGSYRKVNSSSVASETDPLFTAWLAGPPNISTFTNDAGYLTAITGYVPNSRTLTINGVTQDLSANRSWTINSMVYPGAGIAVSTGAAWSTSITDNSANWNTAYTDRNKWDGGATGLIAATGRTSLGGTTIGQNVFTSTNPSAITFGRANADNTFDWLSASSFLTAIGAGTVTGTGTTNYIPKWSTSTALTNSLLFDDGTSASIGTITPQSLFDITKNSLGVTQTNTSGLLLANNTAATSGNQQISPAIRWRGQGWKTVANVNEPVDFRAYVVPLQHTSSSNAGTLIFDASVNGGAYTSNIGFTQTGAISLGGNTGGTNYVITSNAFGTLSKWEDVNSLIPAPFALTSGSGTTANGTAVDLGGALTTSAALITDATNFLSINGGKIDYDAVNGNTYIIGGGGNIGGGFTGMGAGAGNSNTGASFTGVGVDAGNSNTGDSFTGMGVNAGADNTFNNVVVLGANASASANNQLALSNDIQQIKATGFTTSAGRVLTDVAGNGILTLVAPAGGISGLTTNELVYGNSATTIASLPVTTYPSLTELSYVKGVTSGIQAQINTKISGITVDTTTITSGTSGRVAFNNGGVYGESANLTWNGTGIGVGGVSAAVSVHTYQNDVNGGLNFRLQNDGAVAGSGSGQKYATIGQIGSNAYAVSNWASTAVFEGTAEGGVLISGYEQSGGIKFQTNLRTALSKFDGTTGNLLLGNKLYVGGIATTPTAKIHIAAGTAGVNTAPFKYTSGSLMTTAEAGAKEFLTDKEYLTITTGAARKEIALNDIALTSGRIPVATTNGRLTDDAKLTFNTANGDLVIDNSSGAILRSNTGTGHITLGNASYDMDVYAGQYIMHTNISMSGAGSVLRGEGWTTNKIALDNSWGTLYTTTGGAGVNPTGHVFTTSSAEDVGQPIFSVANAGAALFKIVGNGDITTGVWKGTTINQAYLGTGGGGSTKFLREDNTWQAIAGSGTVTNIATAGLISGGPITTTGTITTSMTTNKLVGRSTAGTGVMEEITLGTGLSFTGTTLNSAGITRSISSISANTTAGSTASSDYVYFTSTAITLTLPTAIGNTNRYTIVHTDTATLTIATTSAQTIAFYPAAPATTATITTQGVVIELFSDGANWWTI